MNIEIRPENKTHKFFRKFHSKSEDILFSIIQKVPKEFIPSSIMGWLDRYIDKRTRKLKEEIIRQKWQQIYLEKASEEIRERQGRKEAP